MNANHLLRYVLLGALTAVWLFLAFDNRDIVIEPIKKYVNKEASLEESRDEITKGYPETIGKVCGLIDLNGLCVRIMGGRECNNVVKLSNGSLATLVEPYDTSEHAQSTILLGRKLKEEGIDFLYVQAPDKMNTELLPYGLVDSADDNVDAFLSEIEGEISYLDLRPYFTDTGEHITEYFYMTDHHWNPLGAFKAFQIVSEYLQNEYPDEQINGFYQELDNWEVHKKEQWFLGSRGKRTGMYFGGVDDLIWLTPRFDTEMSCANLYGDEFFYGDYYKVNIRESYITSNDDFESNSYCVYIGGDYPLVQHRNAKAPVDKKVLIIKDSFVLPLQTYFSTVYNELDVIDLRYYVAGTLYQYIEETKPDLVIMCINGDDNMAKDAFFETGIPMEEETADIESREIYHADSITIESDVSNAYNCISLYDKIEAGKRYTVMCDSISIEEGSTDGISLKLFDRIPEGIVPMGYDQAIWDLTYCEQKGIYEWTFTAPSDSDHLEVLVYAGIAGHTEGKSITMKNVRLLQEDHVVNP